MTPTPYLDDGDLALYHGDAATILQQLPAGIAQTCVTSPPYWGLRDYGTASWSGGDPDCDHAPEKRGGRFATPVSPMQASNPGSGTASSRDCRCGATRTDDQLGLEATPDEYVERLVALFREVRRVLRDDGTLWLNLGDSYTANGGGGESRMIDLGKPSPNAVHASRGNGQTSGLTGSKRTGLKPKDLVGIPWRVAFALQADGWYLRSDIVWSKPNPMPESVTDRPTKAHEYLFLLTKGPRYFYDADAIREPHQQDGRRQVLHLHGTPNSHPNYDHVGNGNERWPNSGRNRRSVWTIPTESFPEAHFATYPQALVRPCIEAGTSERGACTTCGAAWHRVVTEQPNLHPGDSGKNHTQGTIQRGKRPDGKAVGTIMRERHEAGRARTTTSWQPSCDCHGEHRQEVDKDGDPVTVYHPAIPIDQHPVTAQIVLDPFIGSGTTALVARHHGRRAIGIDLSSDYLEIAAKRTRQLSLLSSEEAT